MNRVMKRIRWHWDKGDAYGCTQDWRFALAEYLYWEHGVQTTPGFYTEHSPTDSYSYEFLKDYDVTEQEAQYCFAILTRYREWLRIADRDY